MMATTIQLLQTEGKRFLASDNKGLVDGQLVDGLWLFIPNWSKDDMMKGSE